MLYGVIDILFIRGVFACRWISNISDVVAAGVDGAAVLNLENVNGVLLKRATLPVSAPA